MTLKTNEPLVSVGVCIYNGEKTLNKCVDSILCQTYKNLEIILVNDGSTDGTAKICDDYTKCDKRIKVIHQENKGCNQTVTTCIENATGEYMGFVDSDDWIMPEMYERLVSTAVEHDADIVDCGYYAVDEDGGQNAIASSGTFIFDGQEQIDCLVKVLFRSANADKTIEQYKMYEYKGLKFSFTRWSKITKTLIYKQNIQYIINDIIFLEDIQRLWFNLCDSKKIICIPDVLYYYDIRAYFTYEKTLASLYDCVSTIECFKRTARIKNIKKKWVKISIKAIDWRWFRWAKRAIELSESKMDTLKQVRSASKGIRPFNLKSGVLKTLLFLRMYRIILWYVGRAKV